MSQNSILPNKITFLVDCC